jgi:CheY-like chemotaxis protein
VERELPLENVEAKDTRVLVVDDDAANRYAIGRLIESFGVQALVAGTVREAIDLLARAPHFVVLDWRMPDGGGAKVLRQMREMNVPAKVIVVTVAYEELYPEIIEFNPDAVLRVPFRPDELLGWFIQHGLSPRPEGDQAPGPLKRLP